MDDALSSDRSLDEALLKQAELIKICKVGGFNLHKWLANNRLLLMFLIHLELISIHLIHVLDY